MTSQKDTFEEMLEFLNFKQKKKLLEVIYAIEHKAKEDYKSWVFQQIKKTFDNVVPSLAVDYTEEINEANHLTNEVERDDMIDEAIDKFQNRLQDELLEVLEK